MKLGAKILTVFQLSVTSPLFMDPEWKNTDIPPPNVKEDTFLGLWNITRNMELKKLYYKLIDERVSAIDKELLAKEIVEILDDPIIGDFIQNYGQNILSGGLLDDWDYPNF